MTFIFFMTFISCYYSACKIKKGFRHQVIFLKSGICLSFYRFIWKLLSRTWPIGIAEKNFLSSKTMFYSPSYQTVSPLRGLQAVVQETNLYTNHVRIWCWGLFPWTHRPLTHEWPSESREWLPFHFFFKLECKHVKKHFFFLWTANVFFAFWLMRVLGLFIVALSKIFQFSIIYLLWSLFVNLLSNIYSE